MKSIRDVRTYEHAQYTHTHTYTRTHTHTQGGLNTDRRAHEHMNIRTGTIYTHTHTNTHTHTHTHTGGLILTEDRIILFGAKSNQTASASDFVTGTTMCTYLCCCSKKCTEYWLPCCIGLSLSVCVRVCVCVCVCVCLWPVVHLCIFASTILPLPWC